VLGENESISGLRLQTCNRSLKKIDETLVIDRHRGRGISRGISRRRTFRLIEQISSIGLFAVTESQCTEDEHDDEDDSKFRNLVEEHPTGWRA
jgi:hypothetical protein